MYLGMVQLMKLAIALILHWYAG